MSIYLKVKIDAPAEIIWPFVADPIEMARWNPKLVAVDRSRDGPVTFGECYQIIYRMSSKETEMEAMVERVDRPFHLTIRQRSDDWDESRYALESYTLTESADRTRLTQHVDLSHAGVPLPIRLLIRLMTRFGRATGKPYLEKLKELAEAEVWGNGANLDG